MSRKEFGDAFCTTGSPSLRRDQLVDLDAGGSRAHEGGIRGVPDVLHVDDGVAGRAERRQQFGSALRRGLGLDERERPTREVVVLDVDDEQQTRHGSPFETDAAPILTLRRR